MNQPTENKKVHTIVKSVVFTFIITALLAAAAWYVLIYSRTIALVEPVEETEVKEGSLDFEVVSNGELLPLNAYPVSLPESFFREFAVDEIGIESIVAEGTRVEKGSVVARLDRSVYEAQKTKLESDLLDIENKIKDIGSDSIKQLKDVKLALENARLDLEIRKIAVEQSLFDPVSAHERMKLEYSKSTLAYENALLNYQDKRKSLLEKYAALPAQAESLSGEAKAKLSQLERSLEIKSPYSGVFGNPEDIPEALKGITKVLTPGNNKIGEVTDAGRLVSQFFLEEEWYSSIRAGQEIRMYLRSNGVEIEGKVTKIHPKIEEINGKKGFFAEARVENPGLDLLPNQTSINRIKLQTLENVLYVPNSAVMEEGDRFFVFTSGGVRQEIECKRANENYTQIIKGLSKGQMIYLYASEGPSN